MAKCKTILLPPKTESGEAIKNFKLKDDSTAHISEVPPRQGPKHKAAQELAQLYTRGEDKLMN